MMDTMNTSEFYLKMIEDSRFIDAMLEKYLKYNHQWKQDYSEVIGKRYVEDFELSDIVTDNDNILEVYIIKDNGDTKREYIIRSSFLKWIENRKNYD